MLDCKNLTCVREDKILFQNLTFKAQSGEILQVEGPNGVGKTSLFRLIIGLSVPYSGEILWNNTGTSLDRESFHENLLYLGHKSGVKPELTSLENLQFFQKMYPSHNDVDLHHVLAKVGLAGYEDVLTAQLSAGQQRRVALARLWLNDCPLWILDEPFTAIDKSGVAVLESLIVAHAGKGGIVILTTHQDLNISKALLSKVTLTKGAEEQYV